MVFGIQGGFGWYVQSIEPEMSTTQTMSAGRRPFAPRPSGVGTTDTSTIVVPSSSFDVLKASGVCCVRMLSAAAAAVAAVAALPLDGFGMVDVLVQFNLLVCESILCV